MKETYDPQDIEKRVQGVWAENKVFEVSEDPAKEKFYCLSMLPYPSGAAHMGHVRNYTIGDLITRYQRMLGKNVLQPIGWDAFGLPAENAAIKNKVPPAQWTYGNIDRMRGQLKALGYAYDWTREVATCRPEYYRWEQLMFVRLFEKGLVYRKNAAVNWDPVDQTVLANEQVIDGRGWRSGAVVERREIPQWFLKITAYADELLTWLDKLDGWPDAVKTMQRNWIGRSEGAEFDMVFCDQNGVEHADGLAFTVFTTRPDTSFGMTYAVLAPEHPLVERIVGSEQREAVAAFVDRARNATDTDRLSTEGTLDKRGVFTGAHVLNPFTGKPVPVYLADYVLMTYGTGAIMAVPGQDQRDWDFAKAHDLPIIRTVQPPDDFDGEAYTGDGPAINSDWLDGLPVGQAKARATEWLEEKGIGRRKVNYRLRDWGVSRQRYWGCPIPMIYCADCGDLPVPEEELPVVLPEDVEYMGTQSPIKADPEWRKTRCPKCGGPAERETDTFDTFMESSWYYARYCCPDADGQVDQRANYWLPVDQYIGGIEHAILHLLYFRFYHKLMRDSGMVTSDEPATRLLCQGMVVAETFYREDENGHKTYYNPVEVVLDRDEQSRVTGARLDADGQPVIVGPSEKMSKSKNNGVDPQPMIDQYGADTVRFFAMSDVPPDYSLEWSERGVEGAHRFLHRLWRQVYELVARGKAPELDVAALSEKGRQLRRKTHETIRKVSDDIERYHFNTAIAAVRELLNAISSHPIDGPHDHAVAAEAMNTAVLILSTVVPHIAQELWQGLGHDSLIIDEQWPKADESALTRDTITVVVQVNGKLRARLEIPSESSKEDYEQAALADDAVRRHIGDKQIRKVVVVPGRLVNLVAR